MSKFKHNEFEIMQDSWKVYAKYYDGADKDNDIFWESCIKEFEGIINKHKSNFAKEIVNAFLNDICRRSKVL